MGKEMMTVEMWATCVKAYIDLFNQEGKPNPYVEELLAGHDVSISDLELLKNSDFDHKVLADSLEFGGEEILIGFTRATTRLFLPNPPRAWVFFRRERPKALGDLSAKDVGHIVAVNALVKKRSYSRPHARSVTWQCMRCGCFHIVVQDGLRKLKHPLECYKEGGGCGRGAGSTKFRVITGYSTLTDQFVEIPSILIDEQWLEVQEPPEDLEGDAQPSQVKVRLLGSHLRNKCLPGDKVVLQGRLILDDEDLKLLAPPTVLDAYFIELEKEIDVDVTDEEKAIIEKVAAGDNPLEEAIVPSVAPHIHGHAMPKAAVGLQLFGGLQKQLATKPVRGNVHILMVGDPSTAKTELQRFACRIAARSILVNAKGASAVGLTAAAVQDKTYGGDGGWVLKAGALVLADHGLCGIDEIGELEDKDYMALNEAMEQQTCTVVKAGIATTMNARTSILAAGNPKGGGKWDTRLGIADQVNMPDSTFSRFDLFFLIRDDISKDEAIRQHINKYYGVGEWGEPPPLTERLLRAYVSLARRRHPRPTPEALAELGQYHDAIRDKHSTFTVRTYEQLIRLAVAVARTRLSDTMELKDAKQAIVVHRAGWELAFKDGQFKESPFSRRGKKGLKHNIKLLLEMNPDGLSLMDIVKNQKAQGFSLSYDEMEEFINDALLEPGIVTTSYLKKVLVYKLVT